MDFRLNMRKLAFALLCAFLVLLLPLTYWQVVVASRLQASPHNERSKVRRNATRRGSIFDRNGRVLAETREFGAQLKQRVYPLDEAAAHVVGYSARVHGRAGIERTQDAALMASGPYRMSPRRLFSPRGVGCNVTLTLDAEAQRAIYAELGLRKGAALAIDPRTGEVLVMVSAPSFRPAVVDDEWAAMRERSDAPLLNRAAARRQQSDAALRLVIATAAIDSGAARPTDTFRCQGSAEVAGVRVQCGSGRRRAHGQVSLTTAVALPCRTTLATLAVQVGPETLGTYIERFGLRGAPDVELSARGCTVPSLSGASPADFIAACLDGQGVLVTPLAMCSAVAGIANQGTRMRPYLVESVADVNGRILEYTTPRELGNVCSPAAAAEMTALMTAAAERGTAARAGIPDMQVAGVSGSTAQRDGTWAPWFFGFAPADAPQVAVAVVIEDGGSGGSQAAALGQRVLQAALR